MNLFQQSRNGTSLFQQSRNGTSLFHVLPQDLMDELGFLLQPPEILRLTVPNPEIFSRFNDEVFWMLWVDKNISPRHTNDIINLNSNNHKWRNYALTMYHPVGNIVYASGIKINYQTLDEFVPIYRSNLESISSPIITIIKNFFYIQNGKFIAQTIAQNNDSIKNRHKR